MLGQGGGLVEAEGVAEGVDVGAAEGGGGGDPCWLRWGLPPWLPPPGSVAAPQAMLKIKEAEKPRKAKPCRMRTSSQGTCPRVRAAFSRAMAAGLRHRCAMRCSHLEQMLVFGASTHLAGAATTWSSRRRAIVAAGKAA